MTPNHSQTKAAKESSPVWGCVLIGGGSSRMGTPKHLLKQDGVTWLELICAKLQARTEHVVISGNGVVPESLHGIPVVEDVKGLQGPLAGILALFRQYSGVSWLVAACDMPDIEDDSLVWLLSQRGPDIKAVLPDLRGNGMVEPLLAYYDQSCHELLERAVTEGSARPGALVGIPGILTPQPPTSLLSSWNNFNSLEDMSR